MNAAQASRRDWITGASVFAVAALLRLSYVAHAWSVPAARFRMVDSRAYHERALEILAGDWLGHGVFYQDPLYPYFVAGLYRLFGSDGPGALFAQAFLDSFTAALVFAIARSVFGYRTGVVAGVLAAFYKLFLFYDAQLLKVSLTVFLITIALFLVVAAVRRGGGGRWLAAGGALGLASLTRGNYLLFPPLLALWIAVTLRGEPRRAVSAVALLGVGLVLAIAPVTARNRLVGGDWVLITSQAGQNFYTGQQRGNRSGAYRAPPFVTPNPRQEQAGFRAEAERRLGRELLPSEASRYWARQALTEIAADPEHFWRHTARKLVLFTNDYEVPDNQSFAFFRAHVTPVLGLPFPSFGTLLPLAALGIGLAWRRRSAQPLILFAASYTVSVLLFYNFSRYRMPVVPMLAVFAAAGIVGLQAGWRRWGGPRFALVVLALGIGYWIAFRDVASESFATHHFNLAVHFHHRAAAMENGVALEVEAYRELNRSLAAAPHTPALRRQLPVVAEAWLRQAWRTGREERALALALALTDAYPERARGFALLAECQRRLGREDAARAAARRFEELSASPD